MMFSRSLYLVVAACLIGFSVGFAPARTVSVGARSATAGDMNILRCRRSNPSISHQSTLLYSVDPAKSSFTTKIHNNKNKIAALALVLTGIGLTNPSPCFAASNILSNIPSPSKFKEAIVSVLDGIVGLV